jgi:hypothetical protein
MAKIIPDKWRGTVIPGAVPAWFWLWAHWRDLGATGPRPKSAPRLIPAWAWVRYLIHKGYKFADQPPPPPPPVHTDKAPNKCVLFHSNDVMDWVGAPSFYWRSLSADRGQQWITPELVGVARKASLGYVTAWCDCRPDGGTDAQYAIDAVRTYGLKGWHAQAEDAAQFDHALQRGRENGLMPLAFVGQLGQLREDQIALIRSGEVLFIVETYFNVWPYMIGHVDWHNANAGIGGNAVAMYESASEGATRFPLADQKARGLFNRGNDSIYTPGSRPEDVAAA